MSEILDVCCGGRMWWRDKADARAVYMDNRELECTLCDGRAFRVAPDVVGDFRNIPFADGSFAMVLFDPPHLKNVGKNAWTAKKYGILGDDWRDDLRRGFAECFPRFTGGRNVGFQMVGGADKAFGNFEAHGREARCYAQETKDAFCDFFERILR